MWMPSMLNLKSKSTSVLMYMYLHSVFSFIYVGQNFCLFVQGAVNLEV